MSTESKPGKDGGGFFIMEITQELLIELFEYREDGNLYWLVAPKYKPKLQGKQAGSICKYEHGDRRRIHIGHKLYFQNRLNFLYHNGYMPEIVDHKDRNTLNDKIDNLRPADATTNQYNKGCAKNSTSKYKGVCWDKREQRWHVQINTDGKPRHVGYFTDEIEAALAYNSEAERCNGEFANLNIIQV